MSVVAFPRQPHRAIWVSRTGLDENWVARFYGDRFTQAFRTEPASCGFVLRSLRSAVRPAMGLPIVVASGSSRRPPTGGLAA